MSRVSQYFSTLFWLLKWYTWGWCFDTKNFFSLSKNILAPDWAQKLLARGLVVLMRATELESWKFRTILTNMVDSQNVTEPNFFQKLHWKKIIRTKRTALCSMTCEILNLFLEQNNTFLKQYICNIFLCTMVNERMNLTQIRLFFTLKNIFPRQIELGSSYLGDL